MRLMPGPNMKNHLPSSQFGFTLVEAIIVIVITGVLAAGVAVFIRAPVQGYFDSARRAEMTDTADTVIRRISRDLHLALPNSVRVTPDGRALEFLSTRTGGRYRAQLDAGGLGDPLDFATNDTTFDVLGPPITMAAGDRIVIYNLGILGADAYAGNNIRAYNGAAGAVANIAITSAAPFPFDSPSRRFQVVDTPVSYICDPVGRTLTRFWAYVIVPGQANPPAGGNNALLANNVNCTFTYTPGVTQRNGLVSIQLAITQSGETVSLYHQVHVNNVP